MLLVLSIFSCIFFPLFLRVLCLSSIFSVNPCLTLSDKPVGCLSFIVQYILFCVCFWCLCDIHISTEAPHQHKNCCLTHCCSHKICRYIATIDGAVHKRHLVAISYGTVIDGAHCTPESVELLPHQPRMARARIRIVVSISLLLICSIHDTEAMLATSHA